MRLERCCLYCKGKNFRANHNIIYVNGVRKKAVAYIAKVRILEQITTLFLQVFLFHLLLLILQR